MFLLGCIQEVCMGRLAAKAQLRANKFPGEVQLLGVAHIFKLNVLSYLLIVTRSIHLS